MEDYSLKKFLASPFSVKILPYLLIIFALLGFFDATYLAIQHYQHSIPPCTIGGCETVLTSKYATMFFGIPTSLFGSGFYAVVIVLSGLFLQTKNRRVSSLLFALCTFGLLFGLFLIYLQAFVLHAWCYYCLFSELIDFLLFDATWWLWNSKKE